MIHHDWFFYLHKNGDLIGKNPSVVMSDPKYFDSPFVKKVWHVDLSKREEAWKFLLEALALGARIERVRDLAQKWGCDLKDAFKMVVRLQPHEQHRRGLEIFIEKILKMDQDKFWNLLKKEMKE